MLSRNKIKFINSLKQKKFRDQHRVFVVEGVKLVSELINSRFVVEMIAATPDWYSENELSKLKCELIVTSSEDLKKVSSLITPNKVLALAQIPTEAELPIIEGLLSIALDKIQDPGNLGTIIRTADWFGIKNIFCSPDTVDVYNPKVIQSTMGAVFRLKVHYVDLERFLSDAKSRGLQVYGTFLDGENIYKTETGSDGILLFGNESQGISEKCEKLVSKKLLIPGYKDGREGSESLNVSVASAIICSEFRRRILDTSER